LVVLYGQYILEFREVFVQVVDVTLKLSHSRSDKVCCTFYENIVVNS